MRILGIIPARGGSKRVPRKNVRLLGGKPLVAHSIELGLAVRSFSRVVVSSDDDEVLAIARSYRDDLALRRPAEISDDKSPAIDYVRHALTTLEGAGEQRFDAVCILQPSSPLTEPLDVENTIELLQKSGARCAVSVAMLDHAIHPVKLKRLVGDRLVPFFEPERGRMAAYELPELYVRNCAVYVTRRDVIDEGLIVDDDSAGYVMPRSRSVDINDELDWTLCEVLYTQRASERAGPPKPGRVVPQ